MSLFVSVYFKIKSKFPLEKYQAWIKNFLKLRKPMIIFTDDRELIVKHRGDLPIKVIDFTFENFYVYKYLESWEKQHILDHEKFRHNIYLYMIWNEKSNFIKKAIEINPFNSEYFYWTDIGAFRDSKTVNLFLDYPKKVTEKILLLNISNFQVNELNDLATKCNEPNNLNKPDETFISIDNRFQHVNRIGGGIFGGHKNYCFKWWKKYYAVLDIFFEKNIFAGKDQSIMAFTALLNPDIVEMVKPFNAKFDPWFYLEEYLCFE